MIHPALALASALAANAILSLGMVLQKRHIAFVGQSRIRDRAWRRDMAGWIAGFTLMNLAPAFNYLALLGLAPNVVPAIAGTNVAFTALLSALFLGERLSGRTLGLGALLFAAIALAGLRGSDPGGEAIPGLVWLALALPLLLAALLVLARSRRRSETLAIAVGGVAGALGGYMFLPMKLLGRFEGGLPAWLASPWLWLYIVAGASSFSILQLAYKDGRISRVAPAYYGLFVLWPALVSIPVFSLRFDPLQALAFAIIGLSVVLMAAGSGEARVAAGAGSGADVPPGGPSR